MDVDPLRRALSWGGWAAWTAAAALALHRGSFRLRLVEHRAVVGPWSRLVGTLLLLLVAAAQALTFGLADAWGVAGGPDAADEILWGAALLAGAVPLAAALWGRQHYAAWLYAGLWVPPAAAWLGVAHLVLRDRVGAPTLPIAAVGAYAAVLGAFVPRAFQVAGYTPAVCDDANISVILYALSIVYTPAGPKPRTLRAWLDRLVRRVRGLDAAVG